MMLQWAEYLLVTALAFVIAAAVGHVAALTTRRSRVRVARPRVRVAVTVEGAAVPDPAGPPDSTGPRDGADAAGRPDPADASDLGDPVGPASSPSSGAAARAAPGVAVFATAFTGIAAAVLTAYLGLRVGLTGHGPFASQHEFAVSFAWGILVAFLLAQWRLKAKVLGVAVLPVAACLLAYALRLDAGVRPLVPALQNNLLLTLHVGFAVLSYGAACVAFGAAVVYLAHPRLQLKTPRQRFDEIGYRGAVVTFPLMTVMIVLGALWAETAWGRYWGWDPKETAALVTWLLYAGYLHARVARGWRGARCAWLLVIGFAAVMFVYFGNSFLGGLHAYG